MRFRRISSRPRGAKFALSAGAALVLGSLAWWQLAVPALVKYPTDLDVSPRYEGTLQVFVDPSTFSPLQEPIEATLTIERHLEAVGDQSGSSRVLVRETIVERAGDLFDSTQVSAYVLDRRSMANVDDDRAYAFDPDNVVDRSGTYRIQLPLDTDALGTYEIYNNDTATTYRAVGTGETYERSGLTLTRFEASSSATPIDDAFLAELGRSVPLPESLTLDQLQPYLRQLGIDVDALVAALMPVLTTAEREALLQVAAAPIPLEYLTSFSGSLGVDRMTGSEVEVTGVSNTISVKPVLDGLAVLQPMLARHADVAAVAAAATSLVSLAGAEPMPVVAFEYSQTAESVADIAAEVADQRERMRLAERWIPLGLLVLGLAMFLVGWLWPKRTATTPAPPERPTFASHDREERVLVGSHR